jgi:hypothetical protein
MGKESFRPPHPCGGEVRKVNLKSTSPPIANHQAKARFFSGVGGNSPPLLDDHLDFSTHISQIRLVIHMWHEWTSLLMKKIYGQVCLRPQCLYRYRIPYNVYIYIYIYICTYIYTFICIHGAHNTHACEYVLSCECTYSY